jgi:predicted transcriptional regulator
MNIEARKNVLARLLLETEDASILDKIEGVFNEKKDWYDELTEEEKSEIELGKKQLSEGKGIPHEEVMKSFAKWH